MRSLKDKLRPMLIALLAKRFKATSARWLRVVLWHFVRRVDDRHDTHTRRLTKELFDIEVGRYTYGGYRTDGSILSGSRIGAFCSLAPGSRLGGVQHPMDWVSTHPFLWLSNRRFIARDHERFPSMMRGVVLEDDVWIGANAIVANGIRVGRGAVVGAGAVVTKDVEPYAIVAGVPAKQIAQRFTPDQAARLAEIEWPSWDDARIKAELDGFYDVDRFIERHAPARDSVS